MSLSPSPFYTQLCPHNAFLAAVMEEVDNIEAPEIRKITCTALRKRLRKFLESGQIPMSTFLKFLGVTTSCYWEFASLNGTWNGIKNEIFWPAHKFFEFQKEAEAAVMKKHPSLAPKKTRPGSGSKKRKLGGLTRDPKLFAKLNKIKAMPSTVPSDDSLILANCNDIRVELQKFLKSTDLTQTGLCKFLGVAPGTYNRYMKAKGVNGGAANGLYVAAFDFFEKLREVDGRPKTAKRLRTEQEAAKDTWGSYKKSRRVRDASRKGGGKYWVFGGGNAEQQWAAMKAREKRMWGDL